MIDKVWVDVITEEIKTELLTKYKHPYRYLDIHHNFMIDYFRNAPWIKREIKSKPSKVLYLFELISSAVNGDKHSQKLLGDYTESVLLKYALLDAVLNDVADLYSIPTHKKQMVSQKQNSSSNQYFLNQQSATQKAFVTNQKSNIQKPSLGKNKNIQNTEVTIFNPNYKYLKEIKDNSVVYMQTYISSERGGANDSRTQMILEYKNKNLSVVQKIKENLIPQLGGNFAIAVVPPSSKSENSKTASHILAKEIINKCSNEKNIKDASECLRRMYTVPSKHLGGKITKNDIKNSICIDNMQYISGMDVLVLDDIVTSGDTMQAVFELLKEAGARTTIGFAVGATQYFYQISHHKERAFIINIDDILFDVSELKKINGIKVEEQEKIRHAVMLSYGKELINKIIKNNCDCCFISDLQPHIAKILCKRISEETNLKNYKIFTSNDMIYKGTHKAEDNLYRNMSAKTELYVKAQHLLDRFEQAIIVIDSSYEALVSARNLGMTPIGALWAINSLQDSYNIMADKICFCQNIKELSDLI